jgi:PTS system glucitol/sorbitol-specific IIA component
LQAGIQFELGQHHYPVTAVGSVAEQNLRELGHITLRFDGLSEAEFPVPYTLQVPYRTVSRRAVF